MGKKPNNNLSVEMALDKKQTNKVKNIDEFEEPDYESYPNISNVVSANECTGMMAVPPQNEEELESYKELSGMQIPKKK